MGAASTIHPGKPIDLYNLFGLRDTRSDQRRAEDALRLVLAAHPDLAPEGWCFSQALIERAAQERAQPDVILRPRLVEAFAWCRTFMVIGCRRVSLGDWNATSTARMAYLAERAGEVATGQTLPIQEGVVAAAALTLGIEINRGDRSVCAWLAACAVWENRR